MAHKYWLADQIKDVLEASKDTLEPYQTANLIERLAEINITRMFEKYTDETGSNWKDGTKAGTPSFPYWLRR